jgi:hypothetical protein
MSEPENFLARWSRLKRKEALQASGGGERAPVAALPVAAQPPAPAFDPASLPPIESIDAATDIRPFLEACVPEELTRAALRSTWSADPAIRDFIGIAEGQWDFNDPASIPGFGANTATDCLASLALHSLTRLDTAAGIPSQSSQIIDPPAPQRTGAACSDPVPLVQRSAAEEGEPGPRIARSHGGAMPE